MRKWTPLLLTLVAILASVLAAPALPDSIAVHWNWRGDVDGWAPKAAGLIVVPAVMLLLIAAFNLLPRLDPMRANVEKFRPEYQLVVIAVTALLLALHGAIIANGLGYVVPMMRFALVGLGVLFLVLGNIMPRTRRNHIAGFRTRATLASDVVWTRTHRVGGALMMATGVLIALSALAPAQWALPLVMGLVLAMAVGIGVYSSRIAREHASTAPQSH